MAGAWIPGLLASATLACAVIPAFAWQPPGWLAFLLPVAVLASGGALLKRLLRIPRGSDPAQTHQQHAGEPPAISSATRRAEG